MGESLSIAFAGRLLSFPLLSISPPPPLYHVPRKPFFERMGKGDSFPPREGGRERESQKFFPQHTQKTFHGSGAYSSCTIPAATKEEKEMVSGGEEKREMGRRRSDHQAWNNCHIHLGLEEGGRRRVRGWKGGKRGALRPTRTQEEREK